MMFQNLIGTNIEVYVNAMLDNSMQEVEHLKHLGKCFEVMKR